MINIDIKRPARFINYREKIMLIGSCFTEHIGNSLAKLKFFVLQNPNGILFGPDAVCKSIDRYVDQTEYKEQDLFYLNEVWNSWEHHSRFSKTSKDLALVEINKSLNDAHDFIRDADWLIITLGSSFVYRLTSVAEKASHETGESVANCHRAPSQWFEKKLLDIQSIDLMLEKTIGKLVQFNPNLKIIFTVSPVRHIRDGVVENNRSKARLIELVHYLEEKFDFVYYFPAYELVIDVLRDYRFYDIDLVHPNYPATDFVLEKFIDSCVAPESKNLIKEIKEIVTARKHRPFQPDTKAHQDFLINYFQKTKTLKKNNPWLDLSEELKYFSQA